MYPAWQRRHFVLQPHIANPGPKPRRFGNTHFASFWWVTTAIISEARLQLSLAETIASKLPVQIESWFLLRLTNCMIWLNASSVAERTFSTASPTLQIQPPRRDDLTTHISLASGGSLQQQFLKLVCSCLWLRPLLQNCGFKSRARFF